MNDRHGFELARNRADAAGIAAHLRACDGSFVPRLHERVDIDAYALKIVMHAERFEAWAGVRLAGLVAAYCNDPARRTAFITNVSVEPDWQGRGLASRLLQVCLADARDRGFKDVELEVDEHNTAALHLYGRHGFVAAGSAGRTQRLRFAAGPSLPARGTRSP